MGVALKRLEPLGRVARAVLQFEDFEAALGLIFVERGFEGKSSSLRAQLVGRGTIERRFDGGGAGRGVGPSTTQLR